MTYPSFLFYFKVFKHLKYELNNFKRFVIFTLLLLLLLRNKNDYITYKKLFWFLLVFKTKKEDTAYRKTVSS